MNFVADFLLKTEGMGGGWCVAELMSSCLIFFFFFIIIVLVFFFFNNYLCSYGAYFPSLFAGRVANGKLGCPPERSGSRSPSASQGREEGRGQRRGTAPRAPSEHKPWLERAAGIYFSPAVQPPFPSPSPLSIRALQGLHFQYTGKK